MIAEQGSLSLHFVRDHSGKVTEAGAENHFGNMISARSQRENHLRKAISKLLTIVESQLLELRSCKVSLGQRLRQSGELLVQLRKIVSGFGLRYNHSCNKPNRSVVVRKNGTDNRAKRAWGIRLACFAPFHLSLAALVVASALNFPAFHQWYLSFLYLSLHAKTAPTTR